MYVTIPKPITDAMVTDNTAPDSSSSDVDPKTGEILYPGLTTWSAGAYLEGAYVLYSPNNSIYRAAANTSDNPATGAALAVPTWVFIDKNNPYRFLNGKVSSTYCR